ncbi:TPA: hypothetical protein N0F65_001608 [Lagenidium giganteum]|uniref:Uncharacterized protein n=1 Tax=Lagenidium giganteum TaxID=4803 RepID=A0AAV2Z727_9STRA|nr:TPA: hypothetical protein N0F65_001608 [Lagenidium giganteum]
MSGRGKATVRVHARATQQTPDVNAVLALVEKWKEAHGAKYPALTAGHAVLEEEGYVFPHAKAKETAKAAEAEQLQLHQTRVAALKRAQVEKEIAQYTQEIEDVLLEMHRIFEILVPTLEAFSFDEDTAVETLPPSAPTTVSTPPRPGKNGCEASSDTDQAEHLANAVAGDNEDDEDDDDDVEWEDVGDDGGNGSADDEVATRQEELEAMDMNDIVQAYGLGSAAYELTISIPSTLCERSSENEVLFRSLADSVLRIRKRFLPLIDDWSNALTIDTGTNADANAKVTDLRCRLDQATMKWEDLVKESERKRFAHIRPTVVSVPLSAYKRHKPPTADRRRRSEPSALA